MVKVPWVARRKIRRNGRILFIKQPEDIRIDEDHVIVETRCGIAHLLLDFNQFCA